MTDALLLIDLGFGDCGKGTVTDFLTRHHKVEAVVRFNGGPQAAHNVVTPDGRHHTFAQFGSGSFVPGVQAVLSRYMLIEPYALFNEARHLARVGVPDALHRLAIDPRCPVITPAHQAANRLRELARGPAAHGTCGLGIGETMQDLEASREGSALSQRMAPANTSLQPLRPPLHASVLGNSEKVRETLGSLCRQKGTELAGIIEKLSSHPDARFSIDTLLRPTWIEAAVECYATLAEFARITDPLPLLHEAGAVIFEGAQGVLLDQDVGFHPHTTWSRTTFANADQLLSEMNHTGPTTRVGILRSYFTRHGNGPLVTEDPLMHIPETHNVPTGWQGRFRVGPFDAVAARYAVAAAGPIDYLAITHLDRLPQLGPAICVAYKGEADSDLVARGDDLITDLIPPTAPDLVRQQRLTKALGHLRPHYVRFADFIQTLERELRHPIRLLSYGPDATGKLMAG